MAYEIAKLLLEHAGSSLQRAEAIDRAMYLGMPLNEIEEYLDWLDVVKGQQDQGNSMDEGPRPHRRRRREFE
ncbi:MAG: hypothetical protein HQ567_34275 [Candidatus Nealsonbacteria bacterium]|nr:hypothetical protein [Candidatus Nealsonbacteria bacterium]